MAPFDPVSAAIGGALIGLAATLLMLLTGRIAGISGILGDLVDLAGGERLWRLAFLAGLIAAPLVLAAGRARRCPPRPMPGWIIVIVAGLLVGFGTRLGSGCTSGHGICGIARLSPRSIVATVTFMAGRDARRRDHAPRACEARPCAILSAFLCGLIFGAGLVISGMTDTAKRARLPRRAGDSEGRLGSDAGDRDGGGARRLDAGVLCWPGAARARFSPTLAAWPTRKDIDRPLLAGAALFGAGWGLVGLCPGPAIANLATASPAVIQFVAAMIAGMLAHDFWRRGTAWRSEAAIAADG